jgi:transposase
MNENSEVLGRLVVGHKRDGRCQYDPAAKQALIRQCKQPGVSVSRIAMQHGVNANLLRSWIAKSLLVPDGKDVQQTNQTKKPDALPAFVAVQIEPSATPALTCRVRAERQSGGVPAPRRHRLPQEHQRLGQPGRAWSGDERLSPTRCLSLATAAKTVSRYWVGTATDSGCCKSASKAHALYGL